MKTKPLFLMAIVLPLLAMLPFTSLCQCLPPFEEGAWTNIDPATGGITHINVDFFCRDVILCGVDNNGNVICPPPGPPFRVHLWGKCHPSDCDWGTADGNYYTGADGTRWIYVFYNQGFARRYIYLKPSSLYPGNLFMWMYTDFSDPGRPDYIMRNWFHH